MSGWGTMLAHTWTNNVPPSRPSVGELYVYHTLLNRIRSTGTNKISILVLGSTPEFRDWGYEEDLDVTVVDMSKDYYTAISRELRHKNINERLVISRWEDMSFDQEFDLIVGDLSVGNIEQNRMEDFITSVAAALKPGGYFTGKSFFWTEDEEVLSPKEIVDNYYNYTQIHPYTFINHQLGLYCLDKDTNEIDFGKMYEEMRKLVDYGDLDVSTFKYFEDVGWNTDMKFKFFAPTREAFKKEVDKQLSFVKYIDDLEVYSNVFPIYIIKKEV